MSVPIDNGECVPLPLGDNVRDRLLPLMGCGGGRMPPYRPMVAEQRRVNAPASAESLLPSGCEAWPNLMGLEIFDKHSES